MKSAPKVSLIIATHSRPHLLRRAIESAQQAGTDVEVIVVDDASTDRTAEVCRATPGIRYIRSDVNLRTAGARNLGIEASTAPYLGFLDDDDWRLPGTLNAQVKILEDNPNVGLVYGQYYLADQEGNLLDDGAFPSECKEGDLFWEIMRICTIGCLTAVFRKDAIREVGLLDERFPGVDDWDLWVRLSERYPILALPEPVAVWRKPSSSSDQGSSNVTKLYQMGATLMADKWLKLPRVRRELSESEIKQKRQEILMTLSDQILNDMVRTAGTTGKIEKLRTVIRLNPSLLKNPYLYRVLVHSALSFLGYDRKNQDSVSK